MISSAASGSVIPIATSLAWQRERSDPTRWSPLSSRKDPIAIAGPVAAITTGAGNVSVRIANSKPPESIPCPASASPEANTLRSNPPLNTRSLPASTTALIVPAAISVSA